MHHATRIWADACQAYHDQTAMRRLTDLTLACVTAALAIIVIDVIGPIL